MNESQLGSWCRPMDVLIYDEPEWLLFVRDIIDQKVMIQHCVLHQVVALDAYAYRGDFFGYLRWVDADPICDQIHLEINGMKHPSEWTEDREAIMLLPPGKILELYTIYRQKLSIKKINE